MDGLQFFTVAAPYITQSTKALISAYGFENMRYDARTTGVDHFAVKPFSIPRLLFKLIHLPQTSESDSDSTGGRH
jgi:DNA-binding response OmpR family regulator